MAKITKRKTKENVQNRRNQERLSKLCYYEINNDSELLEVAKNQRRRRYLHDKETKKVTSIAEKTVRGRKHQRQIWKECSKRYRDRKKQIVTKEIVTDTGHDDSQRTITEIESKIDISSILNKSLRYMAMTETAKRKVEEKEKLDKLRNQQKVLNRRRCNEIKNDLALLEPEGDKRRYIQNKGKKKVTSIAEKPAQDRTKLREEWKKRSRKYRERKKQMALKEMISNAVHIESQPGEIEPDTELEPNGEIVPDIEDSSILDDPLCCVDVMTQSAMKKPTSAEINRNLRLYKIIAELKKKNVAQRQQIYRLKLKLSQMNKTKKTVPENQSKDPESTANLNKEFDMESLKQSPIFKNIQDFYNSDGNNAVLLLVKNDE